MLRAAAPVASPSLQPKCWPGRCAAVRSSALCQAGAPSGTTHISHTLNSPAACSTAEERFYWEQWLIDIQVLGPAPAEFEEQQAIAATSLRAQRRQRAQAAIEECLTAVVRHGGCCASCRRDACECCWRLPALRWCMLPFWKSTCDHTSRAGGSAAHFDCSACQSASIAVAICPAQAWCRSLSPAHGAVNEKRDHIPPVVSGSAVTFPFAITVAGCAPAHSCIPHGQATPHPVKLSIGCCHGHLIVLMFDD